VYCIHVFFSNSFIYILIHKLSKNEGLHLNCFVKCLFSNILEIRWISCCCKQNVDMCQPICVVLTAVWCMFLPRLIYQYINNKIRIEMYRLWQVVSCCCWKWKVAKKTVIKFNYLREDNRNVHNIHLKMLVSIGTDICWTSAWF